MGEHVNLSMEMVDINVYVHQDIQEVDVKFVMHAKVILASTGERVNLSMEMVVFVVYVHQDIQEVDVKFVMHVKVILA
jgi:hypothetical protein